MIIYDCTLMLLEGKPPRATVQIMYDLLCLLPVIVEYPEPWQTQFSFNQPNSRGRSHLPDKTQALLPCFIKECAPAEPIVFPDNQYDLATAIACDAAFNGGSVRCSFAGTGNTAATEEVLLTIYMALEKKPEWRLELLQEIASLLATCFELPVAPHKPIIGTEIFAVESGVHVDGIKKNAQLYEPFPPEHVGLGRKIVLGTHSGRVSLASKLDEMGFVYDMDEIDNLLPQIKMFSLTHKKAVSEDDLRGIVEAYRETKHSAN